MIPSNPYMAAEAARYVIEDRVRVAERRRAAQEARAAARAQRTARPVIEPPSTRRRRFPFRTVRPRVA